MTRHNNYVEIAFICATFAFFIFLYCVDLFDNHEYNKAGWLGLSAQILAMFAMVMFLAA